ncbi:hypothetical protein PHMEG_00010183 [Phytophthora megakarya]|uniref:ZSWIM1/3 RNaseH-like domain-containing protein n=1 Tax=Phytophthora megakarya TaxID=4795 RepID=A0A225WFP1_9STRA|nr:hypothetical protein PHMEG_00010183 [Phytophthora megakarya]
MSASVSREMVVLVIVPGGFCEKTNSHLVVKETENVTKRNNQLRNSKRGKDEQSMRFLSDTVPRWRRRYICTYGWPDRSRRKGNRPQQKHRGLQCPYRFPAERVYVKGSWKAPLVERKDHSAYKLTHRDVSNLLATIRKELRGKADYDVAVANFWLVFEGQDPRNMVSIDESLLGETGVISLTSSHMHRLFIRFPEKLLIDCTHKPNCDRDEFGLTYE